MKSPADGAKPPQNAAGASIDDLFGCGGGQQAVPADFPAVGGERLGEAGERYLGVARQRRGLGVHPIGQAAADPHLDA